MKESKITAIDLYNEFPTWVERKKFALILVDHMIKENIRYDYLPFGNSRTEFLLEVRNEIEKNLT
jgi:hypothetical protein